VPSELGRVLQKYREQQRLQGQYLQRLYTSMTDMSPDELKLALESSSVERRYMAAFVVGDRRLPWHDRLIRMLTDSSDLVRQSARRGLIILSFLALNPDEAKLIASPVPSRPPTPLEKLNPPVDFGPWPEASKDAQKKAVKDWTDWWAKERVPMRPPTGQPVIPAEFAVEKDPEKMAEKLVKAGVTRRKELVAEYRKGDGDQYTQALAMAITNLPSGARTELRDALTARFTKMKDEEVGHLLDDELPEIRRAAVVSLVQRKNKLYVGRFGELLLDPEPVVQQAAHLALCKLSGQDFGPKPDAAEEERNQAKAKWDKWWAGKIDGK
jgi:HEAT repeat protein